MMKVSKSEILSSLLILMGVTLVVIAYQGGDWVLFDFGHILFPISFLIFAYSKKSIIITIPLWVWSSGALNSLITSGLFDVSVFGLNQKISAVILVIGLLVMGIYYSVLKHVAIRREEQQNLACKKDARDKYKVFLKRMQVMEDKIIAYDKSIDNFLNKIVQ